MDVHVDYFYPQNQTCKLKTFCEVTLPQNKNTISYNKTYEADDIEESNQLIVNIH